MSENQKQVVEIDELMALRTLLGQKPRTDAGVRAQILQLKKGEITVAQSGFEIVRAKRNRYELCLSNPAVSDYWRKLLDYSEKIAPKEK